MSLSRSWAVTVNELRLLRRDPAWLVLMFAVPLLLVGLLRNGVQSILTLSGHPGVPGADFSVPAQAVTFCFYLPALIGLSFLREHTWATWPRLRAGRASAADITIGKLAPMVMLGVLQIAAVFGIGAAAFGLRVRGSLPGVIVVAGALVVTVVAMGAALTAVVRTVQQLNTLGNVAPVGLGALGGALLPLGTLPSWVRHIAPATPQYWAMRGFDALVLDGSSLRAAVLPAGMLLVFAAAFAFVAWWRLARVDARLTTG